MGLFLQDRIGFNDISRLVARALDTVPTRQAGELEDILEADRLARAVVLDS